MYKILITGAGKNGFLGKHLKNVFFKHFGPKNLYDANPPTMTFVGSEFDLTNENQTRQLFGIVNPDIVVHCAAFCGGIGLNKKRPADLTVKNLKMSINIVEMCKQFNVDYLVGLGSCCGYPKYADIPFKEEDYFGPFPEETNSGYGYSKRMLCLLQNSYKEQYGLKSCHLVPANLFGPYDHFDLKNSHVIPALINKFANGAYYDLDSVSCWGTGSVTREFLYGQDCATAILKAVINKPDTELPINIGTGADISIKELAIKIAGLTGFKGDITFTGEVSDGQPKRRLCVERAKKLLGFQAETSLDDGLKETIRWYKENYYA